MLELFHATYHLPAILREGLKSAHQLASEGKDVPQFSLDQMNSKETPELIRFLCRSVFFLEKPPDGEDWVSVLVHEDDRTIKVGNINLVNGFYGDGPLYHRSVMTLPTFLRRRNARATSDKDYENPLTARLMNWDQMDAFRQRYGALLGDQLVFEYSPEFVIPRAVIPPSEFHRTSSD